MPGAQNHSRSPFQTLDSKIVFFTGAEILTSARNLALLSRAQMKKRPKTSLATSLAIAVAFALMAAAAWIALNTDYVRPAIGEQEEKNWNDLYYGEGRHWDAGTADAGDEPDGGTSDAG